MSLGTARPRRGAAVTGAVATPTKPITPPAGVRLDELVGDVIVICPRCGGVARVRSPHPFRSGTARVACPACGFERRGRRVRLDDPVPVRRRCRGCGQLLERRLLRVTDDGAVACPCGAAASVPDVMRLGAPFDPFFGLPVYLQTHVGPHLLWAYNHDHLAMIEAYVASGIRQRASANRALTSRLPRWLKEGSRRAAILKAIGRLRAPA